MNNTHSNKDTLLQLYKSSKAIALRQEPKYKELSSFREEIQVTPLKSHWLPFTQAKRKVHIYQATFAGFGLLFLVLAKFVAVTPLPYPFLLGAALFFTARSCLVAFSVFTAAVAFAAALWMDPAREGAGKIKRHVISHLKGRNPHQRGESYQEALDEAEKWHRETIFLLKRIHKATLDPNEKEKLSNQALLEYSDKGREIVRAYRKSI